VSRIRSVHDVVRVCLPLARFNCVQGYPPNVAKVEDAAP
jgi:hypothetical protein